MIQSNNVKDLLDSIWHSSGQNSAHIESSMKGFSMSDFLILAGWDAAASFGPTYGKLLITHPNKIIVSDTGSKELFTFLLEEAIVSNVEMHIQYQDSGLALVLDSSSPNIPRRTFVHKFKSLILALQLIRDDLDTTFLKPLSLRTIEINRFAGMAQVEVDYFQRLSSWYPAIRAYVDWN